MIVLCYFSHGQWKILLTFTPLKMIFSVISITQLYGTFRYFNSSDPSGFSLGCPWSLCQQLPCRPWHDSRCSWLPSSPPRGRHSRQRPPLRPWAQWGWMACSSSPPPLPPPRTRSRGSSCRATWLARQCWWGAPGIMPGPAGQLPT